MFEIEKGIPVSKRSKFPFSNMEVGDSFVVPAKIRRYISTVAHRVGKKLGRKFISRKVDEENVRFWRVS